MAVRDEKRCREGTCHQGLGMEGGERDSRGRPAAILGQAGSWLVSRDSPTGPAGGQTERRCGVFLGRGHGVVGQPKA